MIVEISVKLHTALLNRTTVYIIETFNDNDKIDCRNTRKVCSSFLKHCEHLNKESLVLAKRTKNETYLRAKQLLCLTNCFSRDNLCMAIFTVFVNKLEIIIAQHLTIHQHFYNTDFTKYYNWGNLEYSSVASSE